MSDYQCTDCGRNDYNSIGAMMRCTCDRYDRNGREKNT